MRFAPLFGKNGGYAFYHEENEGHEGRSKAMIWRLKNIAPGLFELFFVLFVTFVVKNPNLLGTQ